MSISDAVMTKT